MPGFAVFAAVLVVAAACAHRAEFDHQLAYCITVENNGLLDPAAEGCGAALAIAEAREYPQDVVSPVLYRLGRIERQRSHFERAEELIRRSLAIEAAADSSANVASRRIELALTLAGQRRWREGAAQLQQLAPGVATLSESDHEAARGALKLYRARLASLGEVELAARLAAELDALQQ